MNKNEKPMTNWQKAKAIAAARQRARLGRRGAAEQIATFRDDEEGSAIILTLFIFLFMLVMAGLGIDLMRYEMERTHLQATLDSAVLAGAGAPLGSEVADVKAIVEDYFAKNGMSDYLHAIDTDGEGTDDIVTSLNASSVYAEASVNVDTYLMKLSGVDTLGAFGAAQAEVRTPKLEVSLILDVSGSMAGTKLTNMQSAARSFVTTILNGSDPGDAVISLVPFAWNVTPGEHIFNALTTNKTHDYSSCLRFENSDYSDTGIYPSTSYTQQIYTGLYGSFDNHSTDWRSCHPEEAAQILPYSISESDLHSAINGLSASGNTSAHIGLKWGAAMLDSDFSSVFTALQGEGVVDASLSNIPAVYGEAETLKVIVLMADGKNTSSYYFPLGSSYRGPESDLYEFTFAEQEFLYGYTIYNVARRYYESWAEGYCHYSWFNCEYESSEETYSKYYLRSGSSYYDVSAGTWLDSSQIANVRNSSEYQSEVRLDWEEAWGLMSPEWYGNRTGNWGPWNEYTGSSGHESGSTKDTRMQTICSAIKSENVVVYTIGYDISSGGNAETQLQNCASTANHYYPTNGANISAAFNSIASNVQNLRLTQ